MFENRLTHRANYLAWLVVLLLGLMSVSLSLRGSNNAVPSVKDPNFASDLKARAESTALQAATKSVTIGFRASLEMKENVDFLLTPALLVQEGISDDVIITYPSE